MFHFIKVAAANDARRRLPVWTKKRQDEGRTQKRLLWKKSPPPPKLLMGFVFLVELVGSVLEYSGNVSCDAFSDMTVTAVEMLSFLTG